MPADCGPPSAGPARPVAAPHPRPELESRLSRAVGRSPPCAMHRSMRHILAALPPGSRCPPGCPGWQDAWRAGWRGWRRCPLGWILPPSAASGAQPGRCPGGARIVLFDGRKAAAPLAQAAAGAQADPLWGGAADRAGEGDPAWLPMLVEWQDRLGQLQDTRQWLRRLGIRRGVASAGEPGRGDALPAAPARLPAGGAGGARMALLRQG